MDVIRRNTDYALRLIVHLARHVEAGSVSSRRIAQEEGVSAQLASKLLQKLSAAGLVSSRLGKNGGFALSKPPSGISLAEVIAVIQGPVHLNRCLAAEGLCPHQSRCSICGRLRTLQGHVDETLAGISLADLVDDLRTTEDAVEQGAQTLG
jgi:Rrf2 family protein